ncbi:MAG: nucleoside kinase [Bacteroidales bacterium]|nr:nucleoside kinase [Bacteroidales bacterium]
MLTIYCRNTGTSKTFPEGTSLLEMLPEFEFEKPYRIISAKVNHVSQGLKFRAYNNKEVEFLDASEYSGMRVYRRSLSFLFCKAARDVIPGSRVHIGHAISNGYYCRLFKPDNSPVSDGDVSLIKARMQEIVDKDLQFRRQDISTDEAIRIFRDRGMLDKVKLFETNGEVYTDYYTLGDSPDYYYGRLVPSASYLDVWDILRFADGILLRVPDFKHPDRLARMVDEPKTFEAFSESTRWNRIMDLETVGDVNLAIRRGSASELIQVAEALQEKKIVQIAEEIERRHNDEGLKLVLITGPSSSGKSTFCKRLSIQLKACGIRPVSVSTDDYFVNRVETKLLPDGSYDFDNFDTVDHDFLQSDLLKMLGGETVDVPEYNFVTGLREFNGKKLSIDDNTVILVEGIHALNRLLTDRIPEELKFRIFISTLTSTPLDDHNWIPTSDNRLLRRIIRDYRNGSFTPRQTISQWPKVRAAEETWIKPYKEDADVMFNSAYLIEFAVLRNYAEPLLLSIPKNCPEYSEAHRLLKFIHYFTPVSDREIPATSLMREYIGNK